MNCQAPQLRLANGTACLAAAEDYLRRGWSPIALRGKEPAGPWKVRQEQLPTETQLLAAWQRHPDANVGVALGPVSGMIGLDLDGPEAWDIAEELFGADGLPETLGFTTPGGGTRLFYSVQADCPVTKRRWDRKESGSHLIVMGKGAQTVMPPSVHPETGKRYDWPADPKPIVPAPAQLIERAIRDGQAVAAPAVAAPAVVAPAVPAARGDDAGSLIARARAYLRGCDPAVSGQGGHNQTFKVAVKLVKGFGLDQPTALTLLEEEYNPRCQPPWTVKELEHKVADAVKQDNPEGFLRDQQRAATPVSGDVPGGGASPCEDRAVRLATTSLADILPQPIHWLVPDYLPLGKLVLLAGDGGHGKSTLMLALAADLTQGRPCMGLHYDPLPAAEVLLIGCEDDFADTVVPRLLPVGADLSRVFRVDGVRGPDGKVLPFSLAHYQAMERELEARPDVRLVVIDPAGAFIGRTGVDEHKDAELRSLLDPMAQLAARRRVTIILIKHLTKAATAKAVHKVSGSAGYVNAVRAAFVVAPSSEDEAVKLLLPLKFNLAKKPAGLSYALEGLDQDEALRLLTPFGHLDDDDREELAKQLFRVRWSGTVTTDADSLFAEAARNARGGNKIDRCADWLEGFLATHAYPSNEIMQAAQREGFTADNVWRAKTKLKEKDLRNSNRGQFQGAWWSGFGDPMTWVLRPESPQAPGHQNTTESPEYGKWGEAPAPHFWN